MANTSTIITNPVVAILFNIELSGLCIVYISINIMIMVHNINNNICVINAIIVFIGNAPFLIFIFLFLLLYIFYLFGL